MTISCEQCIQYYPHFNYSARFEL